MLFNPLQVGSLTLPNRILLAPLTRTRADAGHMPNALMAEYYSQRATGGLLITECTMVAPGTSAFVNEPARVDRPELLRMIADLQPGEVVVAEKMDRLSRLPLPEAEQLIAAIRAKGARLAIPGLVDLSDMARAADGIAKIVLESTQEMLLKLALQMARDDYETRRDRQQQGIALAKAAGKYAGRKPDLVMQQRIIALRKAGYSIRATADMAGCSQSQVKRIWMRKRSESQSDAN